MAPPAAVAHVQPKRKGPGTCTPAALNMTRIIHSTISTSMTTINTLTMVRNGSASGIKGSNC